jgi:CheY-like chemotaxis protein
MKPRVLIVEDDGIFRRGLARMFSDDEFEVIQVGDGEQAIDVIAHEPPHLIICDFRLPGIDGLGVLRDLRQRGQPIPFILVTAHYSHELVQAAKAHGAEAIFEKPIELKQLKQQCEELLRGCLTIEPAKHTEDTKGKN